MIGPAAHILTSGHQLRHAPGELERVPAAWECDPARLEGVPGGRECAPSALEASADGARSPGTARREEMAARRRRAHGALASADHRAHGGEVRHVG